MATIIRRRRANLTARRAHNPGEPARRQQQQQQQDYGCFFKEITNEKLQRAYMREPSAALRLGSSSFSCCIQRRASSALNAREAASNHE